MLLKFLVLYCLLYLGLLFELLTRIKINQWTRPCCEKQLIWFDATLVQRCMQLTKVWFETFPRSCPVPLSAVMHSKAQLYVTSLLSFLARWWYQIPQMKNKVRASICLDLYLACLNQSSTDYLPGLSCNTIFWINCCSMEISIDFGRTYPRVSDLWAGWHYPTFEQLDPGFLMNRKAKWVISLYSDLSSA